MAAHICGQEVVEVSGRERKLEAAGWGLFFVWVGTALIMDVGWGAGLIGVGIITLLGQAARRYFGLKTGALPVLVGSFFILGGIWMLLTIPFSLIPVLCVAAGIALLVSAVKRNSRG
jgi:hypothetical protein